jgi:hypothetical protein
VKGQGEMAKRTKEKRRKGEMAKRTKEKRRDG